MIKGTRFFSRRLLPLLLAAVMLLGMLPALTLPVLAEEPPASQKLTNTTDTEVTYQGAVGTGRAPSLVVDGDTSHNDNKYFVVGNDQTQEKNETNPANPTYWIQLDLGKKYSLTEMKLFVYHGRALKNLVVLASDSSTFDTYRIIWNADKENFFGLGTGDKEQFPNATVAGDTITLAAPTEAQYVRILNNGHTAGAGQGAHYFEIEVYGTEHTGGAPETTLYNVAAGCNVIVNKWGGGSDRPNSWLTDGIKANAKYIEVCKDKAQDMNAPSYAQIDLGNEYPVSKVNFWNYWGDGRTLKDLHIILSTTEDFQAGTTKEVYNADWTAAQNGLEVQVDSAPFTARYVRIWNDGHDKGAKMGGHYIEVEVWSTEEKKDPLPVPYQLRDVLTIPTYSYTAQGGQTQKAEWDTTHPDVIDFAKTSKEGGKWGGYRYWMVLTPNQDGYSQYENPCLAASNDGVNWVVPNGIENPLSGVKHEPAGTHNCDTDLVYNPDSDELWVYYVWEQDSPAGTPSNLRLIRVKEDGNSFAITSTTDDKPYERLINSQYRYDMQSPAVVRRNANTWLMWSNNSDSNNSGNGWQSQVAFVELYTSTDGKNWTNKQSLADTLVLKGADGIASYIPWHLDVQWVESQNKYWGLFCAYPKGGNTNRTYLLFGTSEDGKTWTTYQKPLLAPRDNKWDNNSGVPGVPMQGHNTMEGVWSLIPEDLKPYTAIQLHADDYLGHAWGGTGNKENLQKFYEYHVAIAQEKGINLYLTLMTGGVPINTFRNLIDMDWLNNLIDNNSCIKGVVFAENHHNGDTNAVAQLTAEYLELFSSKGIYLVLTDIDDANHRMEKWFENDTLFKTAQKHHKYLVINSKSTSSSGYNTVRSFALGTWLSGLADNWGALTDAWAWYEIRYHKLFEPVMNTTYEDVRRVYTFPETLFAMNMLQSYVNGGTVFNAEHPFYCTGVYDEASWVLKESIIPTMRYMIANPAATREQVKDEIKAVYHTDSYLPTNFAEGLYGTAQDNNLLQTSGRYRTLPVLSSKLSAAEASAFGRVLKSADLADKVNILNALYPELSTGDAFVETLLGGGAGQTGRRLLIMNSLFNENKNQSATLTPTDATFATSMGFILTPHTYLIAHETADSIKIDLNNFRTDKDELWVPGESENPDWTSFGNDWNGDHKDYVQDYMKYHISNPKLDKDRDLRSTVITLHTGERPTAVVTRNGGSTKLADDNFYTETYENGIYTLTITHNGQVNVTIQKGSTQPTEPSVTDYSVAPTELPSNGGMIMVTLTGTNLQNGIQIKAGTITAKTSGNAAEQTATLTLPANYSSSSVNYTVQYSLNGTDWFGGKTVRVSGRYTPPVGPVTPSVPTKPGVPERDPFPFTDVSRSSWYYDSIRAAWEKDLIDGVTRTLYKPDDTLTVAQAIKLSAALHQMLNNNGKVTLRNGSPYWYSSYVSYAVDNGIIEKMYLDYTPAQMNAPVKRNEFVHIFYGAMSDYRQINTVADNKIPDVITTDTYALEIYTFYRAGILTGSDKNGTFYPTNDIKRSEVAAILSRMYDKTARKTVSLP